MDAAEAKLRFAEVIKHECPDCNTSPGQLCDTAGVWIHLGRFKLAESRKIKLDEKIKVPFGGIKWGEDLSRDCEEMQRLESWGIFPGGYHYQNCSLH